VAYRVAVGAVCGTFIWWDAGVSFVVVSLGGVLIGLVGAILAIQLHKWLNRYDLADAKLSITITLLTPYAVYLPAEHLHLSGVLATVAAGLWVGSHCTTVFTHTLYIEAKAVWEMMEFLLTGLIFILIGFQLPVILSALADSHTLESLTRSALLVSGVVIVARIVWVFPGAYLPRWLDRKVYGVSDPYPPWQNVAVVSWTGMRGVVSLAAAMALPMTLPDGKTPFPHRDLLQFLTFWVIFATLVGQGFTLSLLIRILGVDKLASTETPDVDEDATC